MAKTGVDKGGSFAVPASPNDDPRTLARLLGALFIGGGVLGALTLLLPHPSSFDDPVLWGNTTIAAVAGIAIVALAGRLPSWLLPIGAAFGTLAVTRAIYYSHDGNTYYSYFYLWVSIYAFYFFGRLWGLIELAVLGAAFAWVLTQVHTATPVTAWLMIVGSLAVAGLLVDLLARQLRNQQAESSNQAQALEAVSSFAHELAMRTTVASAEPAICEAAADVAGGAGAALWRPTADGSGLQATAATDPEFVGTVVLLVGEPSGAIRAFNTREPFFVADAKQSPEVNQKIVERMGVSSVLFQPIMRDGRPIGVLTIYWDRRLSVLPSEVEQIVSLLAAESTIAIDRAELLTRLERAARTDDLTGLPNRRAWDEYLSRELAHSKRLGTPICVALLDLDRFKEYNDRHGHQGGDRFLKQAAGAWQQRIRETDLIARYGGEEFAIALLDCRLEEATVMLDQLRLVTPEGESSSVGLVAWNGEEDEDELVARADAALYEAKRTGRDQTVVA
jgi:diguanylate cyclase (GGDEF)-like protein